MYTKQRRTSLTEKTKRAQEVGLARRRHFFFFFHLIIFWLFFPANAQTARYYVTFPPLLFFPLCMESTSYDAFPSQMVFFYFFWVGWIFNIILIDNSIGSIDQTVRYHIPQKMSPALRTWSGLLPNHRGNETF